MDNYEVRLPPWMQRLAPLYWQLRYCRTWDRACKVRWYRKIRAEKLALFAAGVPSIEIHLVTRHLANPRNPYPRIRINSYLKKVGDWTPVTLIEVTTGDRQAHVASLPFRRLK